MLAVGVVGSRRRNSDGDREVLRDKIIELNAGFIISGGCSRGVDRFAEVIANELGIEIAIFRPGKILIGDNYYEIVNKYYARNKQIADNSDVLIALVSNDRTGGTENTIKYFLETNKEDNLYVL